MTKWAHNRHQPKKSTSTSVGATIKVVRCGSPEDVGSSMHGGIPHPRATIKVAPTEASIGITKNIQGDGQKTLV